jgi:hypothetical protein
MTTTGILRITRWIAFGLIALIALGIGFVEFSPRARIVTRWETKPPPSTRSPISVKS